MMAFKINWNVLKGDPHDGPQNIYNMLKRDPQDGLRNNFNMC